MSTFPRAITEKNRGFRVSHVQSSQKTCAKGLSCKTNIYARVLTAKAGERVG